MENKFLVYSTQNGGLGDRLFGLVSSYLLALLNDYKFRIKLDDDITYADVFTSPIDWWNDDWKLLPLKRGRFNIESDLINNLDFFKTQTLSEKFPDSDCVYIYSNQNFVQYIFENEKYKNAKYCIYMSITFFDNISTQFHVFIFNLPFPLYSLSQQIHFLL